MVTHLHAASFANDATETPRYRGVVKRARISLAHARDNVSLSLAVEYRQASALLCSSGFDGQLGPPVEQVKQLAVNGVYQHPQGFNALIAQFTIPLRDSSLPVAGDAFLFNDLTIKQVHNSIRVVRVARIVRHHADCSALAMQLR